MRSLVVGTAGHIDHGKSALVLALTGTDPDRLKEEKERGITIDLGFAHAPLGPDWVASFVDVPGHERFVRHMLAGAHGLDAVLLVVAADESVMPQTREHFHICRLLGVAHGLLVLTKCDLADAETQALAELELRELVAGSFLEGAPLLRVSSRTGAGLDALRAALLELARGLPARPAAGLTRLPLDRVFTLRGFGTVVTGTLVSGSLGVGEELEVYPRGRRARVRGLHVHGQAVPRAVASSRVAVNLAGVELGDLGRGDVLGRPGSLPVTSLVDVELWPLPGQVLADQQRLRVHLASAERLARLKLLQAPSAAARDAPAAAAWLGQLRLEQPTAAGRGDRLVLRACSPLATLAGARVLDPAPPRRRRGAAGVAHLRGLAQAGLAEAASLMIAEAGSGGLSRARLAARLTLAEEELEAALAGAPGLHALPGGWVAAEVLAERSQAVLALLRRFHAEQPLKSALGREELRRRLFGVAADGLCDHVLRDLAAAGRVRLGPDSVALAEHSIALSPQEARAREALLAAAQAAGFRGLEDAGQAAPGVDPALAQRLVRLLLSEGLLARVGDALVVHHEHLAALKLEVRRRWPPGTRLDVAGVKDLTGLSRKYVIPLLEYLDRERVTRRAGLDRVVLS